MRKKQTEVRKVVEERDAEYGGFENVAETSQTLKNVIREHDNYDKLSAVQIEAVEMIFHKISRMVNGNKANKDNWLDMAGYAQLVADRL